jgi:hypothetical protein
LPFMEGEAHQHEGEKRSGAEDQSNDAEVTHWTSSRLTTF